MGWSGGMGFHGVEELHPFKRVPEIRTKVLPCGGIHDIRPQNHDTRKP